MNNILALGNAAANIVESLSQYDAYNIYTIQNEGEPSKDRYIIPEIKRVFGDTDLGKFKVNLSAGKNYGELKELKI